MSRLTITSSGKPGRTVRVGWTPRSRETIDCPAWLAAWSALWPRAMITLPVPVPPTTLLVASALDTPSSEDSATPRSSRQKW